MITTVINIRKTNIRNIAKCIYIGRGSIWGNPFVIGKDGNRTEVIEKYRQYILKKPVLLNELWTLDNAVLGCYCKPLACHGDVLIELRNKQLAETKKLCDIAQQSSHIDIMFPPEYYEDI